jgi:hypothetical protein
LKKYMAKTRGSTILPIICIIILSIVFSIQDLRAQSGSYTSDDYELLETHDKSMFIAANFLYIFSPGGGFGLEIEPRIANKFRNLSFPIRMNYYSIPHGEHKRDEGYDYTSIVRIGAGIKYFPGVRLQRGLFWGDNIVLTIAQFDDPESTTAGSFWTVGNIWDIGYRLMFTEDFYCQVSLGLGWSWGGKINVTNKEKTSLDMPKVTGVNADGSLELGLAF